MKWLSHLRTVCLLYTSDLLDRQSAAVCNALLSGVVDDGGIISLLRGHRLDDGFGMRHLLFVDLCTGEG